MDGTVFFFYHLREQFINWIAISVLYTTGPQRIANPLTGMLTHCRLLFIPPLCTHPSISSGFTNNLAVSIYIPGCREALQKQGVLPKSTTPIHRPLNPESSALALIAIYQNEGYLFVQHQVLLFLLRVLKPLVSGNLSFSDNILQF